MLDDYIAVSSIRRSMDAGLYGLLQELEDAGWRLRWQGHGWYLYCPCEVRAGSRIRVSHSPQNPSTHVRRVRREAAHCPDRHELDR